MTHFVCVVVDRTRFKIQSQGRIEVYGIRDQKPEKGRDQGTQPWDLESQPVGSGSAAFFAGSGIKILIVFGIRDQNFE